MTESVRECDVVVVGLGPGGEQMVVLTPEQTRQLVGQVARVTAKTILPKMIEEVLPEVLRKIEGGSTEGA